MTVHQTPPEMLFQNISGLRSYIDHRSSNLASSAHIAPFSTRVRNSMTSAERFAPDALFRRWAAPNLVRNPKKGAPRRGDRTASEYRDQCGACKREIGICYGPVSQPV